MKTTLELVREAGLPVGGNGAVPLWQTEIEALIELVRQEQRERIAHWYENSDADEMHSWAVARKIRENDMKP